MEGTVLCFKYFGGLLNGLHCVNQDRFSVLCISPFFNLHNYSHIPEVFTICSHYTSHEMCIYEGNYVSLHEDLQLFCTCDTR